MDKKELDKAGISCLCETTDNNCSCETASNDCSCETKETENTCLCNSDDYVVMACSGASDLGQLSDIIARRLQKEKARKMSCLAQVGAGFEKSIENFKTKNILLIDGCPLDCGKKILENNGLENFKYLRLTDLGLVKNKTELNEQTINEAYGKAEVIF